MKSNVHCRITRQRYQQPSIERIDIAVEQGFALTRNTGSGGNEGLWPTPGGGGRWDDED